MKKRSKGDPRDLPRDAQDAPGRPRRSQGGPRGDPGEIQEPETLICLSKIDGFKKKHQIPLVKVRFDAYKTVPEGGQGLYSCSVVRLSFCWVLFCIFQKSEKKHHVAEITPSGSASRKKWGLTHDKNAGVYQVEHHAAEIEASCMNMQ